VNPRGKAPGERSEDVAHLDADVLAIARALERLGAADRGAAAAGFEDRLMQGSLGALHGVQVVSAQAAELGAMDRAAARADLEEQVFEQSTPALREAVGAPVVLRHTGQPERAARTHARFGRRVWWSSSYFRLAAVMVLAAGAVVAVQVGLQPNSKISRLEVTPSHDLEWFLAQVDPQPTGSDSNSNSRNEDYDADKLAEWLSEGAAS